MKTLIFVAVLVLAAGVSRAADSSKVKQKASETANAAGEYAQETKEEFKKEVESDLAKIKSEIEDLKAKANEAGGAAHDSLKRQIADLEVKRIKLSQKLNQKFDQTAETSGQAWKEMKSGIVKAMEELKAGFKRAKETASGESGSVKK